MMRTSASQGNYESTVSQSGQSGCGDGELQGAAMAVPNISETVGMIEHLVIFRALFDPFRFRVLGRQCGRMLIFRSD